MLLERGGDRREGGDRDRRRDEDDKTLGDWRGGRKEERPSDDRFSGGRERRGKLKQFANSY